MQNNSEIKGKIQVFNMSNEPLIDCAPMVRERANRGGWIQYGEDNLAPQRIVSLLNKSSMHNIIVKNKARMVGGNGFVKDNMSTAAINFIRNAYNSEDLEEILAKISLDYEIYNAFALNITWSNDRKKIARISYLNPSKIRVKIPEDSCDFEDVEGYFVCDRWSEWRKYPPVLYQKFSEIDRSEANQILYVRSLIESEYNEFYGQPEYLSAFNWIELEWGISQFHNKGVKQGFHPSMVINFASGVPSDDEMKKMIGRLRSEYEGAENSGKVIFTFSDGKDNAPTITPITLNDSDEKFILLNDQVTDAIYKGHGVTNPIIFGDKKAGSLGGKDEILESLATFQSMYIESRQKLIEKTFNKLASINGIEDRFDIAKYSIQFNKVTAGIENTVSICANDKLTPSQKYYILIHSGFDKEEAIHLSGFDPNAEEAPENNI